MRLLATIDWPWFIDHWIVRLSALFASAGTAALALDRLEKVRLPSGTSPDNHPSRP